MSQHIESVGVTPRPDGAAQEATCLCPTQQGVIDRLLEIWPCANSFVLWARSGMGRSTMIRALAQRVHGAAILDSASWFVPLANEHPLRVEETFVKNALESMTTSSVVLIDDFDRWQCVSSRCNYSNPRTGLDSPALVTLFESARALGRKIVLAGSSRMGHDMDARVLFFGFERLGIEDYRFLFAHYLGERAGVIDIEKVFGFAPKLNIHQIRGALEVLRSNAGLKTSAVLEYIERLKMVSNVNTTLVRVSRLDDLKGVDDVVSSLRSYVIDPLLNEDLAKKYGVRAKRGVLLYGPPGTGKTSVGRALAHTLHSKFFRIDGTFITRSNNFYEMVSSVFEAAKDNAPSLIFIDDCDTIFEDRDEYGFYRYLLTELDGLESEEMEGVSVMMTAMNVQSLPQALVRSGRVELWLEMRLPTLEARAQILYERTADLREQGFSLDTNAIAAVTEGFTGADIERVVADARALLLGDASHGSTGNELTETFLKAVDGARKNVEIMRAVIASRSQAAHGSNESIYTHSRHRGLREEDPPPTL